MKKLMTSIKLNDGMTLVEVIVAITVFLIIALAMSSVLLNCYRTIIHAGRRSEAVQSSQQHIESVIADATYEVQGLTKEENYQLQIYGRTVNGRLITIQNEYTSEPRRQVTFITFLPYE